MDRLRRSFRDSFRKRKEHVPESSKPHQWQADEACVRAGTCSFYVKYLGCVEVFESRGMQVCEEALKVLRNSRRRPVKAELFVSGDGLRVVEEDTKGLIVDQTIEKVSFCAPDRNHEKGFSYICRDGTTRRWMCHGFLALRESGERLSHAVGCAFAACLERKQKRDKECGVTMTFDPKNSTFTRTGSFRQASLTERLQDPQDVKPTADPPPAKTSVFNPYAIERPHATMSMLQRQGSFRGFQQLNQASPFKRQMSLRISDLPSNLERQRSLSLESSDFRLPPIHMKAPAVNGRAVLSQLTRSRLQSLPNAATFNMSPIPESSPTSNKTDSVSAMCQQLSQGLSLLSSNDDFLTDPKLTSSILSTNNSIPNQLFSTTTNNTSAISAMTNNLSGGSSSSIDSVMLNNNINNLGASPNMWAGGTVAPLNGSPATTHRVTWGSPVLPHRSTPTPPPLQHSYRASPVPISQELPRPEQWLGSLVTSVGQQPKLPPPSPPRRAPHLAQHLRAHSLGSAETFLGHRAPAHNANGQPFSHGDPFDAEWAAIAARNQQQAAAAAAAAAGTNPFVNHPAGTVVKAFQVHM